nr:phospholipase D-like domain-containing protein [Burkholderia ambifaria]
MTAKTITTPMALNKTSSASTTLPWFVDLNDEGKRVEFHPVPCSYKPLVNGKEAFGAVYDAIAAARFSVEIICWGFQPSMYFKRGNNETSLNIGDLLIKKALEGVRVRILCWADTVPVSQYSENSTPGMTWLRHLFTQNEHGGERDYDRAWFKAARAVPPSPFREKNVQKQADEFRVRHAAGLPPPEPRKSVALQGIPCIEMMTRDFSLTDRHEIIHREMLFREDKELPTETIVNGLAAEPSHHQKSVMVDYEDPDNAVGFVMGHNTLDAYWDDDKHSYARMYPRFGRNGATPRQDMSAVVTGPILEHLNVNFTRAWERATGVDLTTPRKPLASKLKVDRSRGTVVMAQLLRTQSQEGRRDIRSMYKQTTDNATQYIYIENQYFRWPPLVEHIKNAINKQTAWGRDSGKHGPLYFFVVTNSNAEALDHGQVSTYRMMESLGHAGTIPNVARAERLDQQRELTSQLNDIDYSEQQAVEYGSGSREQYAQFFAKNEVRRKELLKQREAVDSKIKSDHQNGRILPSDIPGLKALICTLVAPDSPAGQWMDVYVHSKIMIIDDVFLTHGSANINTRSMEVDSELNICHEHGDVTKALRKRLWTIHTKPASLDGRRVDSDVDVNSAQASGDNIGDAFKAWGRLISRNAIRRNSKKESPYASLVEFASDTTTRSRLD